MLDGVPLPASILVVLAAVLAVAGVVAGLKPIWPLVKAVSNGIGKAVARRKQDQRRAQRRARFADYIEGQMRRLGEKEEWRDNQYAELEAEIEVRRSKRRGLLRSKHRLEDVRRLPSLSRALESVTDRIVLLEGDPGSGKSVALRHLTQMMALRLVRKPSEEEVIPLYINLKEFNRGPCVTAADVRQLVFKQLNRGQNRDIDRYLEEEFDRGVEEGTWLFLFDSFDEIPAVLSATDSTAVVEAYSDAIYNFLHGLGRCRGIVASREFRGPSRQYSWPKFRIMPLSWPRKVELINKADLPSVDEANFVHELEQAAVEIRRLSDNPMFLGLMCEHIRDGHGFPGNAHMVIESYVQERFDRDAERIADIFGVTSRLVRNVAEELSFEIADHQTLGLTVDRRIAVLLLKERMGLAEEEILACLDALEYIKLARPGEEMSESRGVRSITFAHRRLQEYFATCVVLADRARVSSTTLLTDGRWRETAVTILQVQGDAEVRDLLCVASDLLAPSAGIGSGSFEWPQGQYHILQVLADGGGFPKYPTSLNGLAEKVDTLLKTAWETGSRRHRKWALEVCCAATPDVALELIREAFENDSEWLREEAYTQARRVRLVSADIEREIRQTLLDFSISGEVRRSHASIHAQLRRIANPGVLVQSLNLLRVLPYVDATMCLLFVAAVNIYTSERALALMVLLIWSLSSVALRVSFARTHGNRARWVVLWKQLVAQPYKSRPRRRRLRFVRKYIDPNSGKPYIWVVALRVVYVLLPFVHANLYEEYYSFALLVLLGALWLPGALLAVRNGMWTAPVKWPGLPLLPAALFIGYVRRNRIRRVAFAFVKRLPVILAPVILVVVAMSVSFGILLILDEAYPQLFDLIPYVIIGGSFVGLTAYISVQVVVMSRDRKMAEVSGELSDSRVVDVRWLGAKLARLRSPMGVVLFLRNIRTMNPAPAWDQQAVDLLRSLAEICEGVRTRDQAEARWASDEGRFKQVWQEFDLPELRSFRVFLRAEVLDEMGRVDDSVSIASHQLSPEAIRS
ncbi:hypothetical protein DMH04_04140 [Kibdelosporangium aridum]|uniref:NACHT domain-containing protein n=1 Tax=Kibdelosporangium aridum TaxID=2030 RepID=A0A428ZRH9_KIBAR|nr:hypothetical protein DMH04_04140 [Kibdelosporangium aridum]